MNDLKIDKTIQAAITGKKVKNEYQKKIYIARVCCTKRTQTNIDKRMNKARKT